MNSMPAIHTCLILAVHCAINRTYNNGSKYVVLLSKEEVLRNSACLDMYSHIEMSKDQSDHIIGMYAEMPADTSHANADMMVHPVSAVAVSFCVCGIRIHLTIILQNTSEKGIGMEYDRKDRKSDVLACLDHIGGELPVDVIADNNGMAYDRKSDVLTCLDHIGSKDVIADNNGMAYDRKSVCLDMYSHISSKDVIADRIVSCINSIFMPADYGSVLSMVVCIGVRNKKGCVIRTTD